MKNKLGLVTVPLGQLQVGQSVLLGPYKKNNSVSSKILQANLERGTFVTNQMLLVDVKNGTVCKMYLVTRTE